MAWDDFEVITNGFVVQITPRHRPMKQEYFSRMKLSKSETLGDKLKEDYSTFEYEWASSSIRDRAFQNFLCLSPYWMKERIMEYKRNPNRAWSGLLIEPFVYKLLTGTGVIVRIRCLESEGKTSKIKLGLWQKNVYRDYSEIDIAVNVCNVPHSGLASEIFAIVPSRGMIFGIARRHDQGVNGSEIEELFKAGVFEEFSNKYPNKVVQMIWFVEAQSYKDFRKQEIRDCPLEGRSNGIRQKAVEVDLLRICEFSNAQKRGNVVNMAAKRRWREICDGVQNWVFDVRNNIEWQFYRFRGVIGL